MQSRRFIITILEPDGTSRPFDAAVLEERLRAALQCERFISYVAALRKYKSGGYYTFNARELQQYLNHALCGA